MRELEVRVRNVIAIVVVMAMASLTLAADVVVESPDGAVRLTIAQDGLRTTFSVKQKDVTVIESSPISFAIDGVDMTSNAQLGEPELYTVDETYETRGVHSQAINRCKGVKIPVQHQQSRSTITLEARAYNDGVAFRLIAVGDETKPRVPEEKTAFVIPAGSTVWYHGMRGHYEGDYDTKDVGAVETGQWLAPPLTFKLPNNAGYGCITEAALINYSGFALEATGDRSFAIGLAHRQPVSYPYELRYSKEDIARLSKPAAISGTITTPWRVVVVGDLNALVNTDIITNLTPPADPKLFPAGMGTEWIKPGRAVWRYLDNARPRAAAATSAGAGAGSGAGPADPLAPPQTRPATTRNAGAGGGGGGPAVTTDEAKEFSRLAAQLGFEHNILEGFWRRWSDEELRDVVDSSRKLNVGIWVWVHSNRLRDPAVRAELFKRCRDFGITGLKIDFFDHEHKEVIDLYQALLREGAQSKVLLNFHGANKPTGEQRMWPNELVRESVRGMEASKLLNRAFHNTTIPFTRYVAGHGEYTVTIFTERRADTTWAHQIASAAVFTAPLLTYAAHPQKLLDNPAVEMIKAIPSTWDETRVLPGSAIGECAALARRKGDTWFVAVLNGPAPRTVQVPLNFLGEGEYRSLEVRDRPGQPDAVQVQNSTVKRGATMVFEIEPGGGYIARFTK